MNTLKRYVGLGIVALIGFPVLAGITWEGTNIVVSNYPASAPATLSDVRAADTGGGWGIVQYDPATDTTTLSNNLVIGTANGTNTFFKIGRTNYPTETLVIRGNLYVKKPSTSKRNGLLLGTSVTNSVQPVVKFDCSTNNEFGLYLESGSILTSYNALVTSTSTNSTKRWICNGPGVYVSDVGELYMTNTTFLNGYPSGLETIVGVVANCTFANGSWAAGDWRHYFKDCVFSNLDVALVDYAALECTVVRCTFTNNIKNWSLVASDRGIRAVDCRIEAPSNTNIICQACHYPNGHGGLPFDHWHYPSFIAQRHIVVNVKNGGGDPITNATVTVNNEQDDATAVLQGTAPTGTNGLTPAIDSERALFVTDYLYKGAQDPAHPDYKQFTYTLITSAPGYATNLVTGVDPDQSWTTQAVTLAP